MTRHWFRRWGWMYRPDSKAGWLLSLLALGSCVHLFAAIDRSAHSASNTLYGVFPFVACVFLLWDRVAARTCADDATGARP